VERRALERFLRETLTISPQAWLNQIRQIDAEVLAQSGKSIKEMAAELGFKQPSHFCRVFKKARGMRVKLWTQFAATFYGLSSTPVSLKSPERPMGRKKRRVAHR
jgi:AraC-like DNA-binding protein